MNRAHADVSVSFVVPLRDGSGAEFVSLESMLAHPWEKLELVCIGEPSAFERLPAKLRRERRLLIREADSTEGHMARMLNQGASVASGDVLFFVCRPVILLPSFTCTWLARLFEDGGAELVYGDFLEARSSAAGNSARYTRTDSFDFSEASQIGPVRGIVKRCFSRHGGYDESLRYAYEYDFRLRLLETGKAVRVTEPLYRIAGSGPTAEASRTARQSWCYVPFDEPTHEWSYIGYNTAEEQEFKEACKRSLKRLSAYLKHRNEPVNCPHGNTGDPSISVVMPVWNRRQYVRAAVESVTAGAWRSMEIIVVDNGSSDGSVEILEQLREKGLIRLYHNPVNNTAAALNIGVRHSRGKYVSQLDSDDLYTPETLAVLHEWMEANPDAALGVSYYDHIGTNDETLSSPGIVRHDEYDRNNLMRTDGIGAARIWHRCVIESLGGFDERNLGNYAEDYDLQLKLSEQYRVLRIPQVLYRYRQNHKLASEDPGYVRRHEKKTFARRAALARRQAINQNRNCM